jgi:hypothetical protein
MTKQVNTIRIILLLLVLSGNYYQILFAQQPTTIRGFSIMKKIKDSVDPYTKPVFKHSSPTKIYILGRRYIAFEPFFNHTRRNNPDTAYTEITFGKYLLDLDCDRCYFFGKTMPSSMKSVPDRVFPDTCTNLAGKQFGFPYKKTKVAARFRDLFKEAFSKVKPPLPLEGNFMYKDSLETYYFTFTMIYDPDTYISLASPDMIPPGYRYSYYKEVSNSREMPRWAVFEIFFEPLKEIEVTEKDFEFPEKCNCATNLPRVARPVDIGRLHAFMRNLRSWMALYPIAGVR